MLGSFSKIAIARCEGFVLVMHAIPSGIKVRRHPVSLLSDIVYSLQPMARELAETIRILRRDHRLSYQDLMSALAETTPDHGQCFGFGKALTELASRELRDDDSSWR